MKELTLRIVFFLFCCAVGIQLVQAQSDEQLSFGFTIPEVAQLDIEFMSSGSLEFEVLPAANVGESPVIQQTGSEELWVNYSSAITRNGAKRSIEAQIVNGNLPEGLSLYVQASSYSGTGRGDLGVSTGETVLETMPNAVIDNIGSCFTGNGLNNGHKLNFVLEITDMEEVSALDPTAFTILYTITDN